MDVSPGRILNHDSKSLDYPLPLPAGEPQSIEWEYKGPVLNQGPNTNTCTGMTIAHFINTEYAKESRTKILGSADKYLDEEKAKQIYSLATTFDEFVGQMPDQDTGSSGLAVCKAAVQLGYATKYEHVFGFDDFLKAIQVSPIMCGTFWYRSQFTPDKDGFVSIIGDDSSMGHEYLVLGVNIEEQYVLCLSSWSSSWGINGRFKLRFNDFRDLLSWQGDLIVPTLI